MSLLTLVVALIVLGVALYLINMIPMEGTIKRIINVVVIISVVLWILQALGLFGHLAAIHIGR